MAGFEERVRIVIDVVSDKATSSLGSFKKSVSEAETGFGKLKAGASSAFTSIASSPAALVSAGAAIGGFVAKGISDFQKLALGAGALADATGLSTEAASKWIEVADHIGVSEGAVSSAFRRLDVAIGSNSKGWQALGIEVAKNADGTTNLSDTFLRAVSALQAIEDPAKRAAASQKLFGKGYAEVAELISRSAPDLAKMLNEVGEAKIITPEEVAKAREFRGAMDDLGDSVQEIAIALGQSLVPTISDMASGMASAIESADRFTQSLGGIGGVLTKIVENAPLTGGLQNLGDAFDGNASAVDRFGGAVGFVVPVLGNFIQSLDGSEKAAKNLVPALESSHGASLKAADAARLHGEALADAERSNHRFIGSADAIAETMGHESDAIRDANDALAEHTDLILSAFDAGMAATEAQRDFADSIVAADEAAKDGKKSASEIASAYDDQTQAAVDAAEAIVKMANEQTILEGGTVDAAASQTLLIGALQGMAQQASGPSKAALEGLIAKLQETGRQAPAPTVTVNDQASPRIQSIRDTLTRFGNMTTETAVRITADTASADRALQSFLSRVRNSAGMVVIGGLTRAMGGPIPGSRNQAVPIIAHGGEYVLDAGTVDAIKKGNPSQGAGIGGGISAGNGGAPTYVTINLPVGSDPTSVTRAQNRYIQRNGSR